jgi:hypothetical protein
MALAADLSMQHHDDVNDREEEEGHDHRIGSEWEAGAGSRNEWS